MKVLVGCESSGVVREAFRRLGHDAWSCDLLPADDGSPYHIQGDVLDQLDGGWDCGLFFPTCTYLCRSGWHWCNAPDSAVLPLKGGPRREAAKNAREFFLRLYRAPMRYKALENPRPSPHAKLPPHSQSIQPWMFGHGETKETFLWLVNLPPLMATRMMCGREGRIHKMPRGKNRWKERSRTFPGIGEAMATQWSAFIASDSGT